MNMLIFAITIFLLIKLFFFILLTNNKKILFLKNFAITNLSSITASVSMFFFVPWIRRMTGLRFSASRWSLFAALAVLVIVESIFYCKFEKEIKKYRIVLIVIFVNLIAVGFSSQFAVYTGHRPSERMFRSSCASNLKQIGLSLKQYAMDYDDWFPDKSGPLGFEKLRSKEYLTDYGVYRCPSCKGPKGNGNQKLNNKIVDYVYRSGLRENGDLDKSTTPLAWDRPENHKDYGNVLFLDGHVKGFYGADWMEQAGVRREYENKKSIMKKFNLKTEKEYKNYILKRDEIARKKEEQELKELLEARRKAAKKRRLEQMEVIRKAERYIALSKQQAKAYNKKQFPAKALKKIRISFRKSRTSEEANELRTIGISRQIIAIDKAIAKSPKDRNSKKYEAYLKRKKKLEAYADKYKIILLDAEDIKIAEKYFFSKLLISVTEKLHKAIEEKDAVKQELYLKQKKRYERVLRRMARAK